MASNKEFKSDMLIVNLRLLGFDCYEMEARYKIAFTDDMFMHPNTKAAEVVLHFLFHTLNADKCSSEFRSCWPTYDKKDQQAFRKVSYQWLMSISQIDDSVPKISPALLMLPCGTKFYWFLVALSNHVMRQIISKENGGKDCISARPLLTPVNMDIGDAMADVLMLRTRQNLQALVAHTKNVTLLQSEWRSRAKQLIKDSRLTEKRLTQLDDILKARISHRDQILCSSALFYDIRNNMKPKRRSRSADAAVTDEQLARDRHFNEAMKRVRNMWNVVVAFSRQNGDNMKMVRNILDKEHHTVVDGKMAGVDSNDPGFAKEIFERDGSINFLKLVQVTTEVVRRHQSQLKNADTGDLSDRSRQCCANLSQLQQTVRDSKRLLSALIDLTGSLSHDLVKLRQHKVAATPTDGSPLGALGGSGDISLTTDCSLLKFLPPTTPNWSFSANEASLSRDRSNADPDTPSRIGADADSKAILLSVKRRADSKSEQMLRERVRSWSLDGLGDERDEAAPVAKPMRHDEARRTLRTLRGRQRNL